LDSCVNFVLCRASRTRGKIPVRGGRQCPTRKLQAATTPIPVASALAALILGGFLGLLGQGARAIVGLKGLQDQVDSPDASQTDVFSAARLLMSLMIGFLAGLAATLAMGIDKLLFINPSNIDVLLGIAAAGYVGTDFIEGFMSRFAPTRKPSTTAAKQTESTPEPTAGRQPQVLTEASFHTSDLGAPTVSPHLTKMEKCFLNYYWKLVKITERDLPSQLNDAFRGPDTEEYLRGTWPICCFGPQPEREEFYRKYSAFQRETKGTLKNYIAYTGAGHEPTC
jgi:hypothetical protein